MGAGGLQHISVSPRPLAFGFLGFKAKCLGPGLDNFEENKNSKIVLSIGRYLILFPAFSPYREFTFTTYL